MADFTSRMDELATMIGHGDLVGECSVNQVYAAVQHNSVDYRHPRGGQALYLSTPLMEHYRGYLSRYADRVLHGEGDQAMADSMEHLSAEVERLAPVEFDDLRRSGHPTVTSDGHIVYDRPPRVRRLTEAELAAKGEAREALEQLTDGGWSHGHGVGSRRTPGVNVIRLHRHP